jgi:hypothetical protein
MKKNVGMIDKAIRVSTALIVGGLYFDGRLSGTWATTLLIVSGIFVLTSFISFCPLYVPFGLSTKKKENN